jgi:hypothetical protein
MRIRLSLLVLMALVPWGCYNDKEMILYPDTNCTTAVAPTYSGTVAPIMAQYCNSCHSGAFPSGGVLTDTYSHLKPYVDNGRLMGSLQWASGYSPMPKNNSKLSNCNINNIQAWITAGALNN